MPEFKDYTGKMINAWNVKKFIGFNKHGESTWEVMCTVCNETIEIRTLSSIKRLKFCPACGKSIRRQQKIDEEVGKKYGKITIVGYYGYREDVAITSPFWIGRCDCGSKKDILATLYEFKTHRVLSCGCLLEKHPDMGLIGNKYGRLTITKFFKKENHKFYWYCDCDCGSKDVIAPQGALTCGVKTSCGCMRIEACKVLGKKSYRKKFNEFLDMGTYYKGITKNGEFLFDKDDYDKVININKYWKINNSGYVLCYIEDAEYQLHRYLMGMGFYDENTKMIVDHINGNRSDCRKANLRICHKSDNAKNCGTYSNNTSGVKGLSWNKKLSKWAVSIQCDKKPMYLGSFKNKGEAIKVRKEAEIKYFGEFIRKDV